MEDDRTTFSRRSGLQSPPLRRSTCLNFFKSAPRRSVSAAFLTLSSSAFSSADMAFDRQEQK